MRKRNLNDWWLAASVEFAQLNNDLKVSPKRLGRSIISFEIVVTLDHSREGLERSWSVGPAGAKLVRSFEQCVRHWFIDQKHDVDDSPEFGLSHIETKLYHDIESVRVVYKVYIKDSDNAL